jgi:hypothetical protein
MIYHYDMYNDTMSRTAINLAPMSDVISNLAEQGGAAPVRGKGIQFWCAWPYGR